ncbi:aminotransferase class I/II-fold pyridoxal phosphate-dependent enzyme, partial [Deinococcus pimensis]|uniref:aminotransferase class I/II-fold pyridoxal phosphate-dependent enzyme n=1 Tax=Deinococcus pimensis TaxID=309888 RepID=UPI0005EB8F59
PPFGEFARAVALARAALHVTDTEGALRAVGCGARLVYTSRPNNPLGTVLPLGELAALAEACAGRGALLVLDEAYAPFLPDLDTIDVRSGTAPRLSLERPRVSATSVGEAVVALHSPGKVHGVVGLRPAYALCAPPVAAALDNLAPAWAL